MNLAKGAVAGLIAAILGALIWAAIVYGAKTEIGYLAWGIGALVGFAVAWGTRGGGSAAAVLAVLLTVASIAGGKYLGAQWMVNRQFEESMGAPAEWTEEFTTSYMADEVIEARAKSGQPAVEEGFMGERESDYPADVWAEAKQRWDSLDQSGRDAYKAGVVRTATMEVFTGNLGVIDIVFFVLGIITAWQIAFRDPVGDGGSAQGA